MRETFRISALSKRTGVSSKAIRYWESLGLMPQAARTHTGYGRFGPESIQRVEFIQKSKSIGLTLSQVAKVWELVRSGRNPCPEVARWTEQKVELIDQQVRLLSTLRRRLEVYRRKWSRKLPCPRAQAEICCLIEDLPVIKSSQGGARHAETLVAPARRIAGAGG